MSPAATQTATDARHSVLEAADRHFYQQGISAVTMADLRDTSGVSLRRLYSLYPHKSDLVAAWLEHRHDTWTASFKADVERRIDTGSAPVDAVFDVLAAWLRASEFRGCGFINTLAETGAVTSKHRTIIARHKRFLVDYLADFSTQPEALAVVVDGAIVQAAVFAGLAPVDAARRAAAPLMDKEPT